MVGQYIAAQNNASELFGVIVYGLAFGLATAGLYDWGKAHIGGGQ